MNTSILSRHGKRWIACLCLCLAAALLAPPTARAVVLCSPDVNETWVASHLDRTQYYWDDKTGFAVALTFTTLPYAKQYTAPEWETLLFHFPEVRRVTDASGADHFILSKSAKSHCICRTHNLPVADEVFLGSVKLSDGNFLLIKRQSGTVRAFLSVPRTDGTQVARADYLIP